MKMTVDSVPELSRNMKILVLVGGQKEKISLEGDLDYSGI